jgi:hypothetical protein
VEGISRMGGPPRRPDAERFWAKVQKTDGCWLWLGSVVCQYGYFHLWFLRDGVLVKTGMVAHKFAFLSSGGIITEGLVLDHLCKNKLCVRPDHLEPVTQRENLRRSDNHVGFKMRQTTCIRGHDLSGHNLRIDYRGFRDCRTCRNNRQNEKRRLKLWQTN